MTVNLDIFFELLLTKDLETFLISILATIGRNSTEQGTDMHGTESLRDGEIIFSTYGSRTG